MYVAFKCNVCNMTFIIPTEDIDKMNKANRYISCNAGHKSISKIGKYDDILECFKQKYSTLI